MEPSAEIKIVDKYYTRYYIPNVGQKEGEDQYVYEHPNSLLIVGIAPTHKMFQNRKVVKIDFNVAKQDRSKSVVKGKRKKGGIILKPEANLAQVTCDDGTEYMLKACVPGTLLEVNERLIQQPDLLMTKSASEAFVAIIMPGNRDKDKVKELLQQYLRSEAFAALRNGVQISSDQNQTITTTNNNDAMDAEKSN
jgi:glycine cleavage system H lipoate-binding protein